MKSLASSQTALRAVFEEVLRPDQILLSPQELLLYSYDASNLKGRPSVVLLPETVEQAAACVRLCCRRGLAFVPRGAGTNLTGASVAPKGEVVIGTARLRRITRLDAPQRRALVECGVVNLDLQESAAQLGLFFAPDPASQKASTLGGNLALNSGGPRCLKYGITTQHVLAVEMVVPEGQTIWLGDPYAEGLGPDLRGLAVGSEGLLGLIIRAWVRLLPKPPAVSTALFSFREIGEAVAATSGIIGAGMVPSTLELMDSFILNAIEQFAPAGYPREAGAVLLAEVEGEQEDLDEMMRELAAIARQHGCLEVRLAKDESERQKLWEGRRGAHAAVSRLRPSVCVEDGTVPRGSLGEAISRLKEIARRSQLQVGYLCHAGDGNFHPLIVFDERDAGEREKVHQAGMEMLEVCAELGGTITGEHGVGTEKLSVVHRLFDRDTLEVMGGLKHLWDPAGLANPGKFIPPAFVKALAPGPARRPHRRERLDWAPADRKQAADMIKKAEAEGRPLMPMGGGTKLDPEPPFAGVVLSTRGLNRVKDYDPQNLTLEAEAGCLLKDAEALVEKDGLSLPFAGSFPENATLGGAVSCADSGPWRGTRGGVGDSLLGLEALLAGGRSLKSGRKVVKNVAGLDLSKMFLGARGGYGLVTSLIFKLQPLAQSRQLLAAACQGLGPALAALQGLRAAGLEPSAMTYLSKGLGEDAGLPGFPQGPVVLADFEGRAGSAGRRIQHAREVLRGLGLENQVLFEGPSRGRVWKAVRDFGGQPLQRLARLWALEGGLEVLSQAAEKARLRCCFHLPAMEMRAILEPGQVNWLAEAWNLGARVSPLKGKLLAGQYLESGEGQFAKKIKMMLDPAGTFPEIH